MISVIVAEVKTKGLVKYISGTTEGKQRGVGGPRGASSRLSIPASVFFSILAKGGGGERAKSAPPPSVVPRAYPACLTRRRTSVKLTIQSRIYIFSPQKLV